MSFWNRRRDLTVREIITALNAFSAATSLSEMQRILEAKPRALLNDMAIAFTEKLISDFRGSSDFDELRAKHMEDRLRILKNGTKYGTEHAMLPMLKLSRELVQRTTRGGAFDLQAPGIDGRGAELAGVDLYGADLREVDFRGANLTGTLFVKANLRGANFSGMDLRKTDFSRANLSGANLSNANLYRNGTDGNLTGANLRGADLRGARFSLATMDGADVRGAKYTKRIYTYMDETSWPPGFDPDAAGAICVD